MAKADDAEFLEVAGRTVRISSPSEAVLLPRRATHQARHRPLLPGRGAGRAARHRGPSHRPQALRERRGGRAVLPEARPRATCPPWMRTVTLSFPSGRTADEVVVDDAAGLAWVVNLGCIELHPHPVRTADLDHPDELRVDLDPAARRPWDDVRTVAMEVKALLEELGPGGVAEDERIARHARQRAHRAALDLHRGAPRGAGAGARGRAALLRWRPASGGRRSGTASSSTTTRTPRIAPRARRTRCARCPTRACLRRCVGRGA